MSSSFDVDWSDRAHPTAHCWLIRWSKTSLPASRCAYVFCKISEPMNAETCVECGSCSIVMHKDHIIDLQNASDVHIHISTCRPSFSDLTSGNNQLEIDQHYWSAIPRIKESCIICKRKNISRTIMNDHAKTSTFSPLSSNAHIHTETSNVPKHPKSDILKSSNGFQCLWCFRSCHRMCWESMTDVNNHYKCDYGKYKNIIVRPQWLQRVSHTPVRFRAQYDENVNEISSTFTPLIVFINKISGGRKGETIYRRLIRLLNPRQIFLLDNDTNIKQALDIYSRLRNTRIAICGGDGSIGWVLSILADLYSSLNNPPVSICPLGTGNDLSRILGWGWCFDEKRLSSMLRHVSHAQPIPLDRWQITFEPVTIIDATERHRSRCGCFSYFLDHPKFVSQTNQRSYQNHSAPLNVRFTNYLSFGLDAAVVLDFHDKRLRHPSKFTSPFKNKLIYLNTSRTYFREFMLWRAWDLRPYMRLICDGKNLTDSLRHCHTVVLLNIPSYGSGTHPWGSRLFNRVSEQADDQTQSNRFRKFGHDTVHRTTTSDDMYEENTPTISYTTNATETIASGRQDISDHKIEVFGLDSIHMALIHIGFRGHRIAQCSEVRIELIRSMPVHMDGEPFYLPESIAINVTHAGQVLVLRKQND